MHALEDLADRLREDANLFDRYGVSQLAQACRLHAEAIEKAVRLAGEESLSLEQAAEESGYSKRRLRELLAEGTIPNAGRKHVPAILRRDLPRKPGATAAEVDGFDVHALARKLG